MLSEQLLLFWKLEHPFMFWKLSYHLCSKSKQQKAPNYLTATTTGLIKLRRPKPKKSDHPTPPHAPPLWTHAPARETPPATGKSWFFCFCEIAVFIGFLLVRNFWFYLIWNLVSKCNLVLWVLIKPFVLIKPSESWAFICLNLSVILRNLVLLFQSWICLNNLNLNSYISWSWIWIIWIIFDNLHFDTLHFL